MKPSEFLEEVNPQQHGRHVVGHTRRRLPPLQEDVRDGAGHAVVRVKVPPQAELNVARGEESQGDRRHLAEGRPVCRLLHRRLLRADGQNALHEGRFRGPSLHTHSGACRR